MDSSNKKGGRKIETLQDVSSIRIPEHVQVAISFQRNLILDFRYFYGSLVNACECPPSYHGVQCEKKRLGNDLSRKLERVDFQHCSAWCWDVCAIVRLQFRIAHSVRHVCHLLSSEYCSSLGCSQKCGKVNDTFRCLCEEEFRLDSDNVTCVEKCESFLIANLFSSWVTSC